MRVRNALRPEEHQSAVPRFGPLSFGPAIPRRREQPLASHGLRLAKEKLALTLQDFPPRE